MTAVVVRPAPPLDPPFDDDLPVDAWAGSSARGQLSLDLFPRPRRLRTVSRLPGWDRPTPLAGRGADAPEPWTPRTPPPPVRPTASPESRAAARRFLGLCVEVLNGYRPAAQVRYLSHPGAAMTIIEDLAATARRFAARRRAADPARTGGPAARKGPPGSTPRAGGPTGARQNGSVGATRTGGPTGARQNGSVGATRTGGPVTLLCPRRLLVSEPRPGAAEATAVLVTTERAWALAFRLEHLRGAWLCTTATILDG